MSPTVKTLFMVFLLIAAFILANILAGKRMKKAADFIIRDLKEKKAFDPASAVTLPYSKSTMFRIGLKDYRPGALTTAREVRCGPVAGGGQILLAGQPSSDIHP